MSESKGRFFGLKTRQGENLNAKFIRETPEYVLVRDRNSNRVRKFAKTSLKVFQWEASKYKIQSGRNTAFFV